jgi:hypothetical protein
MDRVTIFAIVAAGAVGAGYAAHKPASRQLRRARRSARVVSLTPQIDSAMLPSTDDGTRSWLHQLAP